MKNKKLLAIPVVLVAAFIGWKLLHRSQFRYAGTVEATVTDWPTEKPAELVTGAVTRVL